MGEDGFSERELEAMRQRAEELKQQRGGASKAKDLQNVLDAIAAMPDDDRAIAERFHALVLRVAPDLHVKTWYGFPAYAEGKQVLTFFKSADKGESRYAEVGFNEVARLDDGDAWPTAYAVVAWNDAVEAMFEDLVRRAVGA